MEESFSFGPVGLFNVFFVDLDDSGEAVDDKLFEEGATGDGIAGGLNVNYFEVGNVLEFSYLEQGHDISLLELKDFEFPRINR